MKYKIIELGESTKGYIVQVTVAGTTKYLYKTFKLVDDGFEFSIRNKCLKQVDKLCLDYEYTVFDTLEEAEACLKKFAEENQIFCENKKIIKEGTL